MSFGETSSPDASEPPALHIEAYGELEEKGLIFLEVSVEAQQRSVHLQILPEQYGWAWPGNGRA